MTKQQKKSALTARDVMQIVKKARDQWTRQWDDEKHLVDVVYKMLDDSMRVTILGFFGLEEYFGRLRVARDSEFIAKLRTKVKPLAEQLAKKFWEEIQEAVDPTDYELTEDDKKSIREVIRNEVKDMVRDKIYASGHEFVQKLLEEHGTSVEDYFNAKLCLEELAAEFKRENSK